MSLIFFQQEKERIMLEYAENMTKLSNALEKQKQKQLEDTRQKLLDKRRQRKKNLHHQHIAEAQQEGIPADEVCSVVDIFGFKSLIDDKMLDTSKEDTR